MDVLTLLVTLAVVGFLTWVIVSYVPMPEPFRRVLVVLVIVVVVLWFIRIVAPGFLVIPRT